MPGDSGGGEGVRQEVSRNGWYWELRNSCGVPQSVCPELLPPVSPAWGDQLTLSWAKPISFTSSGISVSSQPDACEEEEEEHVSRVKRGTPFHSAIPDNRANPEKSLQPGNEWCRVDLALRTY